MSRRAPNPNRPDSTPVETALQSQALQSQAHPSQVHPSQVHPSQVHPSEAAHPSQVVHGLPEAISSLLRTIVVALFVLSFITQPMVIPSESMERTLLVGDFLLMNRSVLAPPGPWKSLLPYAPVQRGQIVIFHAPLNPSEFLVKRVIGLPGDHLRIDGTTVFINGSPLPEPWATYTPIAANPFLTHFPTNSYTDPGIEPIWWKQLQANTREDQLVIPAGKYFMLGDNRNHSRDSRYWGFVDRSEITAEPLVIYFSLNHPSNTELAQLSRPDALIPPGANDRLGHETDILVHVKSFARWNRFFHVVH